MRESITGRKGQAISLSGKKILSLLPVVLGLATFRSWTTLPFYDVNAADTLAGLPYLTSVQYLSLQAASLVALAVCVFAACVREARPLRLRGVFLGVLGVMGAVATLVQELDAHVGFLGPTAAISASICCGVALGAYLVVWGCLLMRLEQSAIVVCVVSGMVLDRLVLFAGIQLPWQMLTALSMLLPVVSSVCWCASDAAFPPAASTAVAAKSAVRRIPWLLLATLFVCETMCSVFLGLLLSSIGIAESAEVNRFMLLFSCAGVILVLAASRKNHQPLTSWAWILLIAVIGIAGFSIYGEDHLLLFVGIVDAAGYAFVTLYMLLFPLIAMQRRLPGVLFVALANLVCYRLPEFIGVVLGDSVRSFFEVQSIPLTSAALAMVLVLFGVIVFAFNRPSEFSAGGAGESESEQGSGAALQRIASAHGLADREVEIAQLMLKGRSARVIADDLHLSQSTVHTYQRRLYQKLGIHSKQELIDMIDG